MSAPAQVPLIGRIAVHLKLITDDQLAQATRHQAELGASKQIGQVLVELGFLSQAQLAAVMKARDQIAAKQKAMTAVAAADPVPEVKPAPPAPRASAAPARS
ncbi:MAG: hypothetical protein FJ091_11040, partial [Deltaproteobacteria bacterium]|nr:hypothetical protein [Deltaproteobacteria bacterium]